MEDQNKPIPVEQEQPLEVQSVEKEKVQPVGTPLVDVPTSHSTPPPPKKKKKRTVKRIMLALLLGLLAYVGYVVANVYLMPDNFIQQVYLVPDDAVFIIQSTHPVEDWKEFSRSGSWQSLMKAKSFEDIAKSIESLDSLIQSNETLLSLVGKRDLLISLHKVRPTDWDFLVAVDLQKLSKVNLLKDQLENIFKMLGSTVTRRTHGDVNIIEVRDEETRDVLYLAFVDNHLVVSYTSRLVEAAIDTRKNPKIGLNHGFVEVDKQVSNRGIGRIFINYAALPGFMAIYMGTNEYLDMFSSSMEFGGLYFNVDSEKIEMKGYTVKKDTVNAYIASILGGGKHKMYAHEILPARTALYANIGIGDVSKFVKELEGALQLESKATYDSYASARKKLESWFGISLDTNFLGWMSGEFAIAQLEPGLLGREPELILAIRAKDIDDARKNMAFIEQRIKKRSPVKIKSVSYKDFDINYIELKGFFNLFFGKLFDKFEKPFYTYVGDYVVFSNKSATLLTFIEDYEQKNLLGDADGFKKAYSHYSANSTMFLFIDIQKYYEQLKPMLTFETRKEIQTNSDVLFSFPYWSLQIVGDEKSATLQYVMDHIPYVKEEVVISDAEDEGLDEEAESEKELMNELERFYVEKFQGNVLREYYPEGQLKSESEVKDGKRHGRYREFYENGTLKLRGKYQSNKPKGTWKYYTEQGKFERKEKH